MVVKYDVFVGHSTKDKAVARPPAERLRKDGLKVPSNFGFAQPGMSAHAFGSDWAQLEAGTFQFRYPLDQEPRFIPLRLDDAPIKGLLAQFPYINWCPDEPRARWANAGQRADRHRRQHVPAKPCDATYGRLACAHAFC